jgi:hypothetical protein
MGEFLIRPKGLTVVHAADRGARRIGGVGSDASGFLRAWKEHGRPDHCLKARHARDHVTLRRHKLHRMVGKEIVTSTWIPRPQDNVTAGHLQLGSYRLFPATGGYTLRFKALKNRERRDGSARHHGPRQRLTAKWHETANI